MTMQNWIPMRTDLRHDPAVGRIATKMKVRVEVVIGYLHAVWCWADSATDDGIISGLTLDKAEEILSAPNFLHCMVDVGWLDYIESVNGCQIAFPNWESWMCNSTKKRLKEAKRKQLRRSDKKRTNVRKKSAEKRTPCSCSCSSSSSKNKEEIESAKGVDLPFSGSDLRDAWTSYIDVRVKKKYVISDRAIAALVNKLAKCDSEAEAVECVDAAIVGAWKSFFRSETATSREIEF